jgi:radical SAM superfamily enzyme YgiQ (UPF0313 family)
MHILFVYSQQNTVLLRKPLRGQEEISFGISYIASMLESKGHIAELLVLNRNNDRQNRKMLNEVIQKFRPGLICFTSVFSEFEYISEVASFVKDTYSNTYLLLGGVHITLNPNENALLVFNALCIGEGEYPVLELVQCLEQKKQPSRIANLWIKTTEGIEKNTTRPFIEDLDSLPFPNRQMWQPWILNRETRITVLLGRGCPFNCTYCCNHELRKISEGKYVRLRSPENIINEIKMLATQFPSVSEYFLEVETLGVDINWLEQLCDALHTLNTKMGKPLNFGSNLRVHPNIDLNKIFTLLKHGGFKSIVIGLESGSERIRREILNRNHSNNDILLAAQLAKENSIGLGLFNLVGLPEETPIDFEETLKMNQAIQPQWHATSIFFPYPGTKLFDKVKELGVLPPALNGKNERQLARISYKSFSKKQIQKAFDSFHYKVYKAKPDKQLLKSLIYYFQSYFGHNFMAKAKLGVIKTLYTLHLDGFAKKMGLFGVFQ